MYCFFVFENLQDLKLVLYNRIFDLVTFNKNALSTKLALKLKVSIKKKLSGKYADIIFIIISYTFERRIGCCPLIICPHISDMGKYYF